MRSVFKTPILIHLLRWLLARPLLYLLGWKILGQTPQGKSILIGAPHTSNWDFPLMLAVMISQGADVRWMGKDALFRPPFRHLMMWLGGIPIDRSQANNTVDQMVAAIERSEEITLLITPEGTRSKVHEWKTGFYHIAHRARIPIVLGFIDTRTKTCGFGPRYTPSGNIEADLTEIRAYYADKRGIRPTLSSESK